MIDIRFIVAIPAYNEEKTIGSVIREIKEHVPNNIETLILVVDDGSTDDTLNISKQAGADIIVSHPRNYGVGIAYKTAITHAIKHDADIICTIDADRQFYPYQIASLIQPILTQKTDVVIGSRFLKKSNIRTVPILNQVFNRIMAGFLSILLGQECTDAESGFRALTKDAAKALNLLGIGSFSHDMLLDLRFKKYRIIEIPVKVRYFNNRKSRVVRNFIWYGLNSLISIMYKFIILRIY